MLFVGYDCALFDQIYDFACLVTGATLEAAKLLMKGEADVAINLNGGWHHAHV